MKLCALTRKERVKVDLSINSLSITRCRRTWVLHWVIDLNSLRSAYSAKDSISSPTLTLLTARTSDQFPTCNSSPAPSLSWKLWLSSDLPIWLQSQPFYRNGSILSLLSDIYSAIDKSQPSLLALFDVSAAFDMVDHQILLGGRP